MQQITLEALLNSHSYRKGNGITYPTIRSIVEPWLEKMDSRVEDYEIQVMTPSEMAVDIDEQSGVEGLETEYTTFRRFLIEGVLKPEYQFENNFETGVSNPSSIVTAMLGYFDTASPAVKVYSGYLRRACLNLSVFNPIMLHKVLFADENFENIYHLSEQSFNAALESVQQYKESMLEFYQREYSGPSLEQLFGKLAIQSLTDSGLTTAYSNMVRLLMNNRSLKDIDNIYYKRDKTYTKYDAYQAYIATLTHKSNLVSRPNYSLKAMQLFQGVN